MAPPCRANRKTRGKSALMIIGPKLAHESSTHPRGAMTVRAFVPTWDELADGTATAGLPIHRRRAKAQVRRCRHGGGTVNRRH